MKTQENSLKSSLFPNIISPKLFGNSRGNSYVLFYVSTTPGLRLQQKAEWVNIKFERKDLNSLQKSQSLLSMILEKLDFSFALNLRKQKVTDFSFISLTHNLVLCL